MEIDSGGLTARVGGRAYLVELSTWFRRLLTSCTTVRSFKKATLRRLLTAASEITTIGFDEDEDVEMSIDAAERALFNVSEKYNKQTFVSIRSVLHDAFDRIDELHKGHGKLRELPQDSTSSTTCWPDSKNLIL